LCGEHTSAETGTFLVAPDIGFVIVTEVALSGSTPTMEGVPPPVPDPNTRPSVMGAALLK
jgi:hypothetical protein